MGLSPDPAREPLGVPGDRHPYYDRRPSDPDSSFEGRRRWSSHLPEFNIRDRDSDGNLSIAFDGTEHWAVVLSGHGVSAVRAVYAYMPHGGFDRTFKEMAAAWQGWEGEKAWRSLESELQLVCTHDGLGHVKIAVELRMAWKADWRAEGVLVVEAGQLDALAAEAAAFLDAGRLSGL